MDGTTISAPFRVMPVVVRGGCTVLILSGECDLNEVADLNAAFDACTHGLPVIVDVRGLEFLDSSGLHILLGDRQAGRTAALVCSPGSNIARLLDIVNTAKQVPVFDDVEAALRHLGDDG